MKEYLFLILSGFAVLIAGPALAASGSSASRAANAAESVMADQERNLDDLKRVLTYTGIVTSKSTVVSTEGQKSQIAVMDAEGYVYNFLVGKDTIYLDENEKPTTLGWISQNNKVIVKYMMDKNGVKTAKIISKMGVLSNKKARVEPKENQPGNESEK